METKFFDLESNKGTWDRTVAKWMQMSVQECNIDEFVRDIKDCMRFVGFGPTYHYIRVSEGDGATYIKKKLNVNKGFVMNCSVSYITPVRKERRSKDKGMTVYQILEYFNREDELYVRRTDFPVELRNLSKTRIKKKK